jgi:hypothetical protein
LTTSRPTFSTPLLFRMPEPPVASVAPAASASTAFHGIQREPDTVSAPSPAAPYASADAGLPTEERGVDYERIAEWLARRLEIERERMGVRPWRNP